jgi:hypothetical protein
MAQGASTVEDAVRAVVATLPRNLDCRATDLGAIAHYLNVAAVEPRKLLIAGELHRDPDGFRIYYDETAGEGRRRFTIAHELGHALLERSGGHCPRTGVELEKICDLIATEILLPRASFLRALPSPLAVDSIFSLAQAFKTSLSATAARVSELKFVSVLRINGEQVEWAFGAIRRPPEEIRPLIASVLQGDRVDKELFCFRTTAPRLFRVQATPMNSSQAMVLMEPMAVA